MTTSTASHLNGHTQHSNTFNQHSGICHRVGCYLETFNNTSHYFVAIHPELNSLPAIQTQQRLEIRWQTLTVNLNAPQKIFTITFPVILTSFWQKIYSRCSWCYEFLHCLENSITTHVVKLHRIFFSMI